MEARAAISDGKGNFSIESIEVDEPQGREVLVDIKASGVCHTDWDTMKFGMPLVLGHEGAGIVQSVGELVTEFEPGDKVLLNWAIPCGNCFQCLEGNQHICDNHSPVTAQNYMQGHSDINRTRVNGKGIQRSFNIGTMSTKAVVREEALVKIDVDIPFESACIIGCGVMTGFGSAVNVAKIIPGSSVVVLGLGGVGISVVQGARIAGAAKIIAVDLNDNRLEMSKKFGATHTIKAVKEDIGLEDVAKKVKALNGGRGADYAFECTAVPELGAAPLAMIRNAGMAVQVSGIEKEILFKMELFEWDKIYINPLYGKCRPKRDLPKILQLYKKGDLLLDEMVTQTYALDDLEKAYHDMHEGINAKGVLVMD